MFYIFFLLLSLLLIFLLPSTFNIPINILFLFNLSLSHKYNNSNSALYFVIGPRSVLHIIYRLLVIQLNSLMNCFFFSFSDIIYL